MGVNVIHETQISLHRQSMPAPLYIGIDAGGTKTEVLIDRGKQRRQGNGPPAHAFRDGGPRQAAETLKTLFEKTLGDWGAAPIGGMCAGFAGAGRQDTRHALANALRSCFEGAPVHVVHDARIALSAAFEEGTGAILIAGTGSILFAREEDGTTRRSGGWGWKVGDPGSGDALGKAVFRAALAEHDGGPSTLLSRHLEEKSLTSREEILAVIYESRIRPAELAPLLLRAVEEGDWVAQQLLTREINALVAQVERLARRAGDTLPHRLAYTGGLANEPTYRITLESALKKRLPTWSFTHSKKPPVEGALRLAHQLEHR